MMKPGAKWRLFIPPALAYDNYRPPAIPPGSLLIFDIELLQVESQPAMSRQGNPSLNTPAAKTPYAAKPAAKPASSASADP